MSGRLPSSAGPLTNTDGSPTRPWFRFLADLRGALNLSPGEPGPGIDVEKPNLQPPANTPNGSVGENAAKFYTVRTGGFGAFGNVLSNYHITAAVPLGQFDVGMTSWTTQTNLTGGQGFGSWSGANTPSSSITPAQTYTSGAVVGHEVNVGNRWADFGLQLDVGGTRYTVGQQIIPDVVPAIDGVTLAIYPGSFGQIISHSSLGHQWWVGTLLRYDTIVTGGYYHVENGGSVPGNAPLAHTLMGGYWGDGIDFSGAAFSGAAIRWGAGQVSGTASAGGGAVLPATILGYFIGSYAGTPVRVPFYPA